MNSFPIVAACTICVSLAILTASFDDLRETPLKLDAVADREATQRLIATVARVGPQEAAPPAITDADEGMLAHELAGPDPIQAWLDRTLTPPAR